MSQGLQVAGLSASRWYRHSAPLLRAGNRNLRSERNDIYKYRPYLTLDGNNYIGSTLGCSRRDTFYRPGPPVPPSPSAPARPAAEGGTMPLIRIYTAMLP